jgi:hypothetical protein
LDSRIARRFYLDPEAATLGLRGRTATVEEQPQTCPFSGRPAGDATAPAFPPVSGGYAETTIQ